MREILFRGKRKDNGEWVEGFYVCNRYSIGFAKEPVIYENHYIYTKRIDSEKWFKTIQVEVIPETIGQFTGLTDKNGKKIFEGDIVKITYNDRLTRRLEKEDYESYMKEFCLVEQVVFYKGAFCSKVEIEDIPLYRPLGFDIYAKSMLKELEVIGNIHDNKELLGE